MTPKRRENFKRLLKPRHIAFIGGRYAIIAIHEARRRGFGGEMFAVNPTRSDLEGVPCVASIEELPVAPDAVYQLFLPVMSLEQFAPCRIWGLVGWFVFRQVSKRQGIIKQK